MSRVYSTNFVHARVGYGGVSVLYTVPDGMVAVVRDVLMYIDFDQAGGTIGISSIPSVGSDQYVYLALQVAAVPGVVYQSIMGQVLPAGYQLLAVNLVSEMNCRISGYLLGA